MKQQEIIIGKEFLSFENNGEPVKMMTIYTLSNEMKGKDQQGHRVAAENIFDKALIQKLKETTVPCLADVHYEVTVDRKQKTALKVYDVDFVKEFAIFAPAK